jgi:hypothetical protein
VYNLRTHLKLCGPENHPWSPPRTLPRLYGSKQPLLSIINKIDRESNCFPFAGSRGCQSGSSTSRGVDRPVVVVLRPFAVGIIILMRNSHASDRRSRPGVLCDPLWRKTFIPGDCSNGPGIDRYPLAGGEQAEAIIYLPSFKTYCIDCIVIAFRYRVPFRN